MSTGAVVDGDGSAIGGSPLRAHPEAQPFTCATPSGEVLTWNECRPYFINGREAPDHDGPYVDLMVRFDGNRVHWEVLAHANEAPLRYPYVRASVDSSPMGPGQPVITNITARPHMGERLQRTYWFLVDRYLYTPETDVAIEDAVEASEWLSTRFSRLNSTGLRLEHPRSLTGLTIETVDDGLMAGTFLALPPPNLITFYAVYWSYRIAEQTGSDGTPLFTPWREVDDHSMKIRLPEVLEAPYSEVRVRYALHEDQYGTHAGPVSFERTDTACVSSSTSGRTWDAGCRR